jgi:epoxyqueuosine reductase
VSDKFILNKVKQFMNDHEYHYRIVSTNRLSDLESELSAKAAEGCFNNEFYQERLISFKFRPPADVGKADSIIVIAVPQPIVDVIFEFKGKQHSVTIPPTYDVRADDEIRHQLEQILQPDGYHFTRVNLPLKLLAARSGLVKYGRNNICYASGMGSFHRLVAFYSNLPCYDEHWGNPDLLERCNTCSACIAKCPTHAISKDRFLLRAEQCLTFHNERAKDIPEYIDRSWHHCLLGCMFCQRYCPENKPFLLWSEKREHFSEEETVILLDGTPLEQVPSSTRNKLNQLSLIDDYSLIARNLSLILS